MIDATEVEARLLQAMEVFARMEGNGRRWATDGPWRQMRLLPSDVAKQLWLQSMDALQMRNMTPAELRAMSALRPPRPDSTMIDRAEEAAGWLGWIANEQDRLIVVLALPRKLRDGRVGWTGLVRAMGLGIARDQARNRYLAALGAIARRLNRVELVVQSPFVRAA
jgi:hypothetical protein